MHFESNTINNINLIRILLENYYLSKFPKLLNPARTLLLYFILLHISRNKIVGKRHPTKPSHRRKSPSLQLIIKILHSLLGESGRTQWRLCFPSFVSSFISVLGIYGNKKGHDDDIKNIQTKLKSLLKDPKRMLFHAVWWKCWDKDSFTATHKFLGKVSFSDVSAFPRNRIVVFKMIKSVGPMTAKFKALFIYLYFWFILKLIW